MNTFVERNNQSNIEETPAARPPFPDWLHPHTEETWTLPASGDEQRWMAHTLLAMDQALQELGL